MGSSAQLAVEFPNGATARHPNVALPLVNGASYLPSISVAPPYPTALGAAPDLVLPRSYQWNVAVEKAFGQTQAVSVTYVGQSGRDLLRTQALYRPNANFNGEFLLMKNDALSNYNALQVQYRRRASPGVQVLASYTFSHSLDNASSDEVIGLTNAVLSGGGDYSSSNFECTPQRFCWRDLRVARPIAAWPVVSSGQELDGGSSVRGSHRLPLQRRGFFNFTGCGRLRDFKTGSSGRSATLLIRVAVCDGAGATLRRRKRTQSCGVCSSRQYSAGYRRPK